MSRYSTKILANPQIINIIGRKTFKVNIIEQITNLFYRLNDIFLF